MSSAFVRALPGTGDWRFVSLASAELPGLESAPRTRRILAENLLRCLPGEAAQRQAAKVVAGEDAEIDFVPGRVLLQDHSGVPVLADLAAIASALLEQGLDPAGASPVLPVDLVVDHSVEAHVVRRPDALALNMDREYSLNAERYRFLHWAQQAFPGLRVVPPGRGIVHQMHLEHLAQVVTTAPDGLVVPDTMIGTDSHTPMINALGVLGWGVGGIEASIALLGDPIPMLAPEVVGVRLRGRAPAGVLATDIALALTEFLRSCGVVGAFVEFHGEGARALAVPDRATIANMAPEYGSTTAYFPVDNATLDYLRLTDRSPDHIALVEAYCKEQGLFAVGDPELSFSRDLDFDLGAVVPSVAGPRRPQDRVAVSAIGASIRRALDLPETQPDRQAGPGDGSIAIAAITSCSNTSNPAAMFTAGLLARRATERGLTVASWVKTSLAPGSRTVTRYLEDAGVLADLRALGFEVAGYGCTTCIGNSGDLLPAAARAAAEGRRMVAVLSGNRNFEGRIHSSVNASYLMSPPLVVAFALAGTVVTDLASEPLGMDHEGRPIYLADLWPSQAEVSEAQARLRPDLFGEERVSLFSGDERWDAGTSPSGPVYDWPEGSTYLVRSPLVRPAHEAPLADISGARVLVFASDSTTTDHISPAGAIPARSPAGAYLQEHGIRRTDFNSYGCRRGNHEVLVRGTFAGSGLRNRLTPGRAGGWTVSLPSHTIMTVYDAAQTYRASQTPVIVLAGRDYGMGSSRDWAAKGPSLLGVRAVLAESFERIHRGNLAAAGILPLQFPPDLGLERLGLTGEESYDIEGLAALQPRGLVRVRAMADSGELASWTMTARVDTQREMSYFREGGVLPAFAGRLLTGPARR